MAIEPISVGISGTMAGFAGNSRGMSVYRSNKLGMAAATEQIINGRKVDQNSRNDGGQLNNKVSEDKDTKRRFDSFECETCENRRYQDGSDDSGVSCQTPTKFDPAVAAAKVRGHEQEHVTRNRAKAEREGNEIVSQSVTLHTGICPECGKVYISGGTTRTAIKSGDSDKFNVGLSDPEQEKGGLLDVAV